MSAEEFDWGQSGGLRRGRSDVCWETGVTGDSVTITLYTSVPGRRIKLLCAAGREFVDPDIPEVTRTALPHYVAAFLGRNGIGAAAGCEAAVTFHEEEKKETLALTPEVAVELSEALKSAADWFQQ